MTERNAPTLSPEARRLEQIRRRLAGDPLLNFVVGLASGQTFSMSLNITLILDGVLVRGQMTGPQELASALDAQVASTLQDAAINFTSQPEPEDEREIRDALRKTLERASQRALERSERRIERGQTAMEEAWGSPEGWDDRLPNPDELPDDVAVDAIEALAPPSTVTLKNAEILWPVTGRWTPVGYMRVALSHVSGWCFTVPEGR
jgi:hypothetical protein